MDASKVISAAKKSVVTPSYVFSVQLPKCSLSQRGTCIPHQKGQNSVIAVLEREWGAERVVE